MPDPFSGCAIHECTEELTAPMEIFCDTHYLLVPREIRHDLESLVSQKETDLAEWRRLVELANAIVAAGRTV
jgi:hypothetical protein